MGSVVAGPDFESFVRRLPKAELHVHLEGTLEPELLFELAEQNGIALPYATPLDARAAYEFDSLQSFLDAYYLGTSVLVRGGDFEALTYAYLYRAAADGVQHVEPFFDPQAHSTRGIPLSDVIEGILAGLERGERDFGISWRLIMSFLRDLPEQDAIDTLLAARPWLDRITGIGLDSAEIGNPPEKFQAVYTGAAAVGLRLTAHAGEEGDAAAVERTLDVLGVERVDHGVRAIDDPHLVHRLALEQITLTTCPLSNVRLRVFESVAASPIKRLLDAGVRVTVNSDDPAYFGGYLLDNYMATVAELGFGADDVVALARNSIEGSWADEDRKAGLLARLAECVL